MEDVMLVVSAKAFGVFDNVGRELVFLSSSKC
jgi:hypothetical protein